MTTSTLCRACLSSRHELYCIVDTGLQLKFETLTRIKLKSKDGRPEKLCYICCMLVHKFFNFVSMTQNSDRVCTIFNARDILISENTVSKLKLNKHNFSFSRLRSVSINIGAKNPEPDIKKEVIEINKNTYAEYVDIHDVIKDYQIDSVEKDLPKVASDSLVEVNSLENQQIVSETLVNLDHSSFRVNGTSVNLELSAVVTYDPQEIKQDVESDINNDKVIVDENVIIKKEPNITETVISYTSDSLQHFPVRLELNDSDLKLSTVTGINELKIKQELIEIGINNAELADENDDINNYINQPEKEEPMLIDDPDTNTANSEHTAMRNLQELSTSVSLEPAAITMMNSQAIKLEVIEIDYDSCDEVFEISNNVDKEQNINEYQMSTPVLEHLPVVSIVRPPNRIKHRISQSNTFAENNLCQEPLTSTNTEVATVRHPHKSNQETIEIDKRTYADMLKMTDVLENLENDTVDDTQDENRITDTSVTLKHIPETSVQTKQHLPLISSRPVKTSTSIDPEHMQINSTTRHKNKSDTPVNPEHLPIVAIVRRPHRINKKLTEINNTKKLNAAKDFRNLIKPDSKTKNNLVLDNSVNFGNSPVEYKDMNIDTLKEIPPLISTFKHQEITNGISTNSNILNAGHSSAINEANDSDISVNQEPVVAVVRHPHKLKQEVIEIDKRTFAEMLEITDILDNFDNNVLNGHSFIAENPITDISVDLEHVMINPHGTEDTAMHENNVNTEKEVYNVNVTSMNLNHTPSATEVIQPLIIKQAIIEKCDAEIRALNGVFKDNPSVNHPIIEKDIDTGLVLNYAAVNNTVRHQSDTSNWYYSPTFIKNTIKNNDKEIGKMNGILKDVENQLVNGNVDTENNSFDTSANLSILSNQHNASNNSINLKRKLNQKRNHARINLKHSREPSTERCHRIRDDSISPERSRRQRSSYTKYRHDYRNGSDSINLKRSREVSTERHRRRDDFRRSSKRRHIDGDRSKQWKRAREASRDRHRRNKDSSTNWNRFSFGHHRSKSDKNYKRSPIRDRHRNLDRSSLRQDRDLTKDSLIASTDKHPQTGGTIVNLNHAALQNNASNALEKRPQVSNYTTIHLEQTTVNSTLRNHKVSDTLVTPECSIVTSTEKALKASDTSVNFEHASLKHHQKCSDTSVTLDQTLDNSQKNHTVNNTLKRSVVAPIVTQNDDELIHQGLSPISSDEDDDLFILNHKDPPLSLLKDDLDDISENETLLIIDDKESESLEQLERRLIKEQIVLEQIYKEELLNENVIKEDCVDHKSSSQKHDDNTCCQEHADSRSDNSRLRPCDYGIHQAANDRDEALGDTTKKVDNLSSLSDEEQSTPKKNKIENSSLKHCKESQCYSCTDCSKTYKTRRNLCNHVKQKHPQTQILGCHRCDIIITSNTDFIKHYDLNHPGEKYPCTICKMKFKTLNCLLIHKNDDHKIKIKDVNKCDTCDKYFSERLDYKYHILFVHPPKRNKLTELF